MRTIDYGSFVFDDLWIILYIYMTLGWSLITAGKLPCSWLTHETPLFGGICSKSGLWRTTFAFLTNQDSNPVDLYLNINMYTDVDPEMWTCVTHIDVILCFGAHADFALPSAHISTRPAKMWLQLTSCAFTCFMCGTHLARANNMWKHMNQKHIAIHCYVISTRVIFCEFVKDSMCDSKRRDRLVWKMSKMWYYKSLLLTNMPFSGQYIS